MNPGQEIQDKLLRQDSRDKTPGTGAPRTGNTEHKTRGRTPGTGQYTPGQDTQDRTPKTGHPEQDTRDKPPGQVTWDRKTGTEQTSS
jgi:hypothetical protein